MITTNLPKTRINGYNTNNQINKQIEKAEEIKRRISKTKPAIIVFISQPMIGERLADIAIGLNQLLDREEYRIVFKLHPGEYERWRERVYLFRIE